jgi:hypothetical protein
MPCGNSEHAPRRCPRRQAGDRKGASKTARRQNNHLCERPDDIINPIAQSETPHVGIFWLAQTPDGKARLLTAGCPLDQAEPYGDCLTYGPGHYETWAQWPPDRTVNPALRAIVRLYEYEVWPRGRIVFDRSRDSFILYADRKLQIPATIARIATQFHCGKGQPLAKMALPLDQL